MNRLISIALLLTLAACSRDQTVKLAESAADAFQTSHRDNVIDNWQARIKDTPECAPFHDQLKEEGQRYNSTTSAAFHMRMQEVMKVATAAGCRQQTTTDKAGDAYNARYRDKVIQNRQARIKPTPECATYREQMLSEGQKHASAASGKFSLAMQRVDQAATAAGCRTG